MKICVMCMYTFPKGMASTNRIIAYSKGLIAAGAAVEVVMPFPDMEQVTKGSFEGIDYVNTYGRAKSKIKLLRGIARISRYRKYRGLLRVFRYMLHEKKDNCDIIMASTDTFSHLWVYQKIAKIIGAKCVFVADEYPIPIREKLKDKIPKWKEHLYSKILKSYDGYVFISASLKDYFNRLCEKPTHIMHIITDTSRFEDNLVQSEVFDRPYLCYMGNMGLNKDNVDLIIHAFSRITNDFPDLELHLYGAPKIEDKRVLDNVINQTKLDGRVQIKGKIDFEKVASVLMNTEILLASQPNTMRASGGFPTKLGEYLASGKPAIVTRVGENEKYLSGGRYAYFVEPENVEEYANTMKYILNNYDEALKVANAGKKFIEENYSHISCGKELFNFFRGLVSE